VAKILIVEDDATTLKVIERTLTQQSYETTAISAGTKAVETAVKLRPDIILLDIHLPDADGRQICQELKAKEQTQHIPVIFLTGNSAESDVVLGLKLGADDYVTKPFGVFELVARIEAVLRRSGRPGSSGRSLAFNNLTIDADTRSVKAGKKEIALRPKEFDILYILAANSGRIVSRNLLIENTSELGSEPLPRSLDTHIKNLRQKLGKFADCIETVPKAGYIFKPEKLE
jgi:DNA-binding response OmpR family regulator